jgi:trigger factor
MEVSIESGSTELERHLKVSMPAEKIDNEVTQRLLKATKTIDLKGFRKGKVPLHIAEQHYGKGIRQEVVNEMVTSSLSEAIQQENLRPAGQPQIDDLKDQPGCNLEYKATFEVYPDVVLGDFSEIAVSQPVAELSKEDIDNMIETLREQNATFEIVEKPAESGDRINIDYVGTMEEDEFAGGKAEKQDIALGSKTMVPGFEDGLIGLSAGDEHVLDLEFPDDYHIDDLKGKTTQFKIKVNSVSSSHLPEVNEEFFKLHGAEDGSEEQFREYLETNMEQQLSKAIHAKVKSRVMTQLLDLNKIDLPKVLISDGIIKLKQQMMSASQGNKQPDLSMLPDSMFQEEAERKTALSIILSEIIKTEKLTPDEDQVKKHIEEAASAYKQPSNIIDYYYSKPELLNSVKAVILEDQVTELVLSKCQISDEQSSYEEAIKPDPKATM